MFFSPQIPAICLSNALPRTVSTKQLCQAPFLAHSRYEHPYCPVLPYHCSAQYQLLYMFCLSSGRHIALGWYYVCGVHTV
jgi:hypothetical protein